MNKELLMNISGNLISLADSIKALCEEVPDKAVKEKQEKEITLEQVRGILAEKSRSGHTAEVKELISKFGAERLSEISPENYEAVIKEAEKL